MKYLSLCLALGTAITLSACSTVPSKPKTFDQLGQFSAYPLNAQTFRISFQADPNMSYGAAEEITLVKSAQTTVQKGFRFFKVLNDPSNQSQKPASSCSLPICTKLLPVWLLPPLSGFLA
ncbi:hypothetical protein F976_00156 [Acinetobacter baumannii NIPH 1734]|nr:hypothetical protein F976_00156 [Acinetobacter baumannii NIPH 1734]